MLLTWFNYSHEMKKEERQLNAGPTMWPQPLTWPWPWIFQSQIWNCCISRVGCLIEVKWKRKSVGWWTDYLTLNFGPTHDLNLDLSSQILKLPFMGNGRFDWYETNGHGSIIHDHDRDIWLTTMGWGDVLDSDPSDLRCQYAIYTSNK